MKIVIELPDEMYEIFVKYLSISFGRGNGKSFTYHLLKAIKNGTPLPEHHGRLGDLDALEEGFRNIRKELKASDYKNSIEFFVRDDMLLNVQQFIHLCDAIIEGSET